MTSCVKLSMVKPISCIRIFSVVMFRAIFRQETFDLNPIGNPIYDTYKVSQTPKVSFLKRGFYARATNFTGTYRQIALASLNNDKCVESPKYRHIFCELEKKEALAILTLHSHFLLETECI